MEAQTLFTGIVLFLWVVWIFETYLSWRQHRKLFEDKLPSELEGVIPLEKFHKSRLYGLDKSNFGFISSTFSQCETTVLLLLQAPLYAWNFSSYVVATYFGYPSDSEILISLVFMAISTLYSTVVSIPFELYSTFVIEEKWGFNKQTLSLFFTDKLKGIAITFLIGGPALSAVVWIVKWGGDLFYLYVWMFLFVFTLFMMTIYPNVIAPLFNKFEPLEEGELKTAIEALAAKIEFPLTKLYKVDGSKRSGHSNAYMYGFFKNKRIVLFDTLMDQMNHQEVLAVLGHELGHWKMSHVVKMLISSQVQIFIYFYLYGLTANYNVIYTAFGFQSQPTLIGMWVFFSFLLSPVEHVVGFIMNYVSRTFEFQADEFAKKLGYAEDLKSGLIKLNIENLGNMNPDKWYSTYHYSHPPLVERLKAIGKGH